MGSSGSKEVVQTATRVLRRQVPLSKHAPTLEAAATNAPKSEQIKESDSGTIQQQQEKEEPVTQNASEIHQKNETLVERAHEPEIREYEADVGQEQFRLFQQMQRNPALLDTEWGLTHSSQQRAIEASRLSLPESFKDPSEQVHTAENRTTDLEQYFGPRPPEAGPGDQLVLRKVSNDELISFKEIIEIFTKRQYHPDYYTDARLAEEYEVREEDMAALLQYTCPPTYVRYKDDHYGVYEIRDFDGDQNLLTRKFPGSTFDPYIHPTLRQEKFDSQVQSYEEPPVDSSDDPNRPQHKGPKDFLRKSGSSGDSNALRHSDTKTDR